MFMMTAKVDKKRLCLLLAAAAAVTALVLFFTRDKGPAAPQEQPVSVSTNEDRVRYLSSCGWEVAASPVQTQEVRIPAESNEVLERYNTLQKSQGFDLMQYGGKVVTRYVYQIENYPDAPEPVYATLLIYKDRLIGADITETAADGAVRPLT